MHLNRQAPSVAVAHVVLETDRMSDTAQFMRTIGMRAIFDGPDVSVYEVRGGTHVLLMRKNQVTVGDAPFDLMVDDLHETHRQFTALGMKPSAIEERPAIDHSIFTMREPGGHVFTFYSSHASGQPV